MRSALLLFPLALLGCGQQPPAQKPAEPVPAESPAPPENGRSTQTKADGTRLEGAMRDGKRVGIWRSFGSNGQMMSQTEYREGKPHGPSAVFHPNGMLYYTGDNYNGAPIGEWRFQDEQGTLLKTVVYDSTGHIASSRP